MPFQRLRAYRRTRLRGACGDRGDQLDPERVANYMKLRVEVASAAEKLATRVAQNNRGKGSGKRPASVDRPGRR